MASPKVVVVDYGAGNLRSVARAVAHAGHDPVVTSDPREVSAAGYLIVPGVGAAADTMRNLKASGMVEPVRDYIASGKPFFGVCMGQQALLTLSEEGGEHPCLDIIPGRVKKLAPGQKIPHMGWNTVRQVQLHPIFEGIPDDSYFYFVHSYAPHPDEAGVVIGETEYTETFASVLAKDNIVATQFHPEKSGEMGLKMYANFLTQ
jgi:glutamine amidotransferase